MSGWARRPWWRCAKPALHRIGKPQSRSVWTWTESVKSDRISVICRGAKTSSNSRSMKPVIAPQDHCAPPGALCPKRSSTTARKLLPIGKPCERNIRQSDWRRAPKQLVKDKYRSGHSNCFNRSKRWGVSAAAPLRMHRLQEPFRGYLPPDSRFSRARQDFAPDRGKLQPKADVVAETTYRFALRPAGMLTVDELR